MNTSVFRIYIARERDFNLGIEVVVSKNVDDDDYILISNQKETHPLIISL